MTTRRVHRYFRNRRGALLLSLLVASLVVAGAIAWEATRAARAERATAESVLREYAGFAAWEFARASRQHLDIGLDRALSALCAAERRRGVEKMFALHPGQAEDCGCGPVPHEIQSFFHVTPGEGLWRVGGAPVSDDVRAAVAAPQLAEESGLHAHSAIQLRIVDAGDRAAVVVWRAEREGARRVLHGFVADPGLLTPLLGAAEKNAPLLPPALVDRAGTRNVLSIGVRDPRGRVLYQSSSERSQYSNEALLDARLGGLTATATLAPQAAPSLIIGGLPQSRLPWIYGLIAFAALLVCVGLAQIRRELELARLRSEFVSGVSHELRTPLTQIRMFAETLTLGRVRSAEESRRSLEIILQESQRLSQLVDNVLCFARVERGMVLLQPEEIDLSRMMEQFVESLQHLVRSRRACLHLTVPPNLRARLDEGAMRQMLINLVDNALKYGPAGQTVSIGAARQGARIRLWVEDEGPGIPSADRDHIWEPFWRGPGSAEGGSGIGLAIVRDLAATHGGRVSVERADGGGARFVIELTDMTSRVAA